MAPSSKLAELSAAQGCAADPLRPQRALMRRRLSADGGRRPVSRSTAD